MDDLDREDDPIAAARRWESMLAAVDAEIRDDARPEAIEARRRDAEARGRWRNLPPVRLRPGVPTSRLTDAEADYMDRSGY